MSWDDAFGFLVERLRAIAAEHGPEALAVYTGRGNFELGLNETFAPAGPAESSGNAVLFPARPAGSRRCGLKEALTNGLTRG